MSTWRGTYTAAVSAPPTTVSDPRSAPGVAVQMTASAYTGGDPLGTL